MSNLTALQTELLKPSVLKEGHLLKIGRKMKLPKMHYFVLKPCGVYCYGTQDHDIPHGYIPLEPIEDISLSLGSVVDDSTRLHCIKIADRKKQHVLACHSMEIRNSWITAILTAVAQNYVYENDSDVRRRLDSSNSDELDGVFCDLQCQFTSPFWTNNEAKRKMKAKRLSMADLGVIQKPSWLTKGKKKGLRSKSLSMEDIHSIYTVADSSKPPLTRKRSLHDLTRYFFSSNSSKTENESECSAKLRDTQAKSGAGKKRWSLFPGMLSFGGSQGGFDHSMAEHKKMCAASNGERGSASIFDTKL
jgi:hypothetical protein